MYGLWEFKVAKQVDHLNLFQTDEVCTHQLVNKVQLINKKHEWNLIDEDTYKVSLMDNYKVEAVKCSPECSSDVISGKWSPIYTQLMTIELDNGMRFITNFRYNLKDEISPDPTKDDIEKFKSLIVKAGHASFPFFDFKCDETMIGYIQMYKDDTTDGMKNFRTQCFYGHQVMKYNVETTELIDKGKEL